MTRYWTRSQIVPVLCVALAALTFAMTLRLPEPPAFQQLSAKVWPITLALALAVAGVAIFVENLRRTDSGGEEPSAGEGPDEVVRGRSCWIFVAALALAGPGFYVFGFWLTSVFLIAVIGWLKETRDRWLRAVLTALLLPTVVHLLFTRVFGMYMPVGIIF